MDIIHQQVRREINAMRREAGHARPVPEEIWQMPSIRKALDAAVRCITTNRPDFEFDYELAAKTTALNKAITAEYERRALEPRGGAGATHRQNRSRQETHRREINRGTPNQWECSLAVAEYMAREMEQDEKVIHFRQRFSMGHLLALPLAWEVLTSPLYQTLSLHDFHLLGLPCACWPMTFTAFEGFIEDLPTQLREHDARWHNTVPMEEWKGSKYAWYVVGAETPDGKIERTVAVNTESVALEGRFSLMTQQEFMGETGPQTAPALEPYESAWIDTWGPDGQEYTEAWMEKTRASVVSEAYELAFEILECGWPISLADALRFLLTGIPPVIAPVTANISSRIPDFWCYEVNESDPDASRWDFADGQTNYSQAVLFVQPWVLPEALADFWRKTRAGGNRSMPLAHNVSLFRFVIEHTPADEPFQWQFLADRWNERHGQRLSRGEMQVVYTRTRNALLPGQPGLKNRTRSAANE